MSNEAQLHFRRCHVCGEVNCVAGDDVKSCLYCNKVMAPFFFFKQTPDEGFSDISDFVIERDKLKFVLQNKYLLKSLSKFHYQPLRGFSVIW